MRHELAFRVRAEFERRDRRLHVRPVFRERVEKGRDEHVTGQAAERIEMNVQIGLPDSSGRPISSAKYSVIPGPGMRYRGDPGWGGSVAEPASAAM